MHRKENIKITGSIVRIDQIEPCESHNEISILIDKSEYKLSYGSIRLS